MTWVKGKHKPTNVAVGEESSSSGSAPAAPKKRPKQSYGKASQFIVPEQYVLCLEAKPVLDALALFRSADLVTRAKTYTDFLFMYGNERMPSAPGPMIYESIIMMKPWLLNYEDSDMD